MRLFLVKGEDNPCALITEINVAALRDFQYRPGAGGGLTPLLLGLISRRCLSDRRRLPRDVKV